MEKVWVLRFLMSSVVVLATSLRHIVRAVRFEFNDLPTRLPTKLDDIPVVLPNSWPTVDPTYVPENISAEVIEGSQEVVKRLKAKTGYLLPNRKPNDFHNYDRRDHGMATKNYCEYEGRYVRKGAQKYIPESDKVAVCRSVNPLWISLYACDVLLNTPEKYKDMTERRLQASITLCKTKPGMNTKPPVGVPKWQERMNNASERMKTGVFTTVSNRFYRRLRPLSPSSSPNLRRKTTTESTAWDGKWDPKWDELKSRPVTMRRDEAALRAAGLWITTEGAPGTGETTPDEIQQLLGKIKGATLETPLGATRTLPFFDPSTGTIDLRVVSKTPHLRDSTTRDSKTRDLFGLNTEESILLSEEKDKLSPDEDKLSSNEDKWEQNEGAGWNARNEGDEWDPDRDRDEDMWGMHLDKGIDDLDE